MQMNTAAAAAALGISQDLVISLCEAGELCAGRTRRGFWFVEKDSLTAWRAAHSEVAPGAQDAALKKIVASKPARLPHRCHFCGKRAIEWIARMLPGEEGEFEERWVGYCGNC